MNDLHPLRHSCAHLLAAAVLKNYPSAKLTIGPATDDGFYYDIDFDTPLSEDELPELEKQMHNIVQTWKGFESQELSYADAKERFKDNEYKLELIEEIHAKGEPITLYTSGDFTDLCRGGHVETPSKALQHFKLLSLAGAYWRGDEKNKMLTRIYGTAFETKEDLNNYLTMLEEAKKRDHKVLGKQLGLFTFSDLVGKGLPLWTAKGATVRREIERFIVDVELKRGYLHVYTPDIAKTDLYKTSGHYPYYKDSMYAPIQIEEEEFLLRPMTCPHHFELYKSEAHSYRELPMRIAELAKLYRFEKSGELMGLLRVRSFCLADAHIITDKKDAEAMVMEVLDLIEYVSGVFGFVKNEDFWYRLSLGDRNDEKKYFKDDASWDRAEETLRSVLKKRDVKFEEAEAEAAFYGPKIDIQMKNVNGKEDTAFTVQYDFVMPKRFNLTFTNASGEPEEPVVIHRSSVGAIERIMAFLIERYAGAFPVWLAPTQVAILPVSEKFMDLTQKVGRELKRMNIRVVIDDSNTTLGAKIRSTTLQKVPYMCIIGSTESDKSDTSEGSSGDLFVTVRTREGKDLGMQTVEKFALQVQDDIENKK